MHRRLSVLLFVISAVLMGLLPISAHAADATASQRSNANSIADLVDRHNAIRQSHGLSSLKFAPTVSVAVSQPWTMRMESSNNLSHNSDFGWKGATRWAENVAYTSRASDTEHLMQMWLDSPGHRQNLLNPDYTVIAVGLVHSDGLTWATANFYAGTLSNAGTLHSSGAAWLKSLTTSSPSNVNVYTTPGTHHVNGRDWKTTCAPYSQTTRCTTQIWSTSVVQQNGRFMTRSGWTFNNMTYLPSARSLWKNNNLGNNATWTADGRRWRTECDTAVTGRNGCRSYIWGPLVVTRSSGYAMESDWIFNNMVQFS
ncbi:MAG: CAP domain-containing protein [Arachnia sp.]